MHRMRSALVLGLFATACLCGKPGQASSAYSSKDDKSTGDTAGTLSDADKSLACPAGIALGKQPDGVYRVGRGIQPPKPLNHVNASFSDEARKAIKKGHIKNFEAISLVRVVVGIDGNPQNICVQRPAGLGLDGEAVKAVQKYRFTPASKEDGTPVPVAISVQVDFKLY